MKKKATSSRLRHRLMLQEEVMTPDEGGGYIRSWDDVANIWAEIVPLNGRERLFAGKLQAEVTHRVTIRYTNNISTSNRLIFESRVFNIRAVMNSMEIKDVLELLVEEGAD